jgi:hypothetical protein
MQRVHETWTPRRIHPLRIRRLRSGFFSRRRFCVWLSREIIFNPQYPSGCPCVTSVGGSHLALNGTVYDPEVVMADNLGGSAVNFS